MMVGCPSEKYTMIRESRMTHSDIVIGEITDPVECAKINARLDRGKRNLDWLENHWSELLPKALGKFVVVAGQEAHIAESSAEARAWAKSTHPEDDGAVVQYVRPEKGPRIYAHYWRMA
jgi:hypothetical protein